MRINHNISALNTFSRLSSANADKSKSLEKLSSGLRINKAGDDAAGLAISEKMRSQIKGLNQASRNAQDGISMIQTTEGALNETHSILQRMRELAVQSSNDTNTAKDRAELQKEMDQLTSEISRIGNDTEFNTMKVLNGNLSGSASDATGGSLGVQITGSADGASFDLKVGAETYSFTVNDNTNAADATINYSTNAITLNLATADVADNEVVSNAIVAALQQAKDGGNVNLQNFSFDATTADTATITAVDGKDYAGGDDINTIISASNGAGGATFTEVGATNGAAGTKGPATFQIGANTAQSFTVDIADMRAAALSVSSTTSGGTFGTAALDEKSTGADEYALDITNATNATNAITTIDSAIETVSTQRSKLGAYQNRLEHTINNLNTASENLTAAESRVRDVDMAKEMMEFTKNNILSQASNAMMAQANQMPQSVLQLLQ